MKSTPPGPGSRACRRNTHSGPQGSLVSGGLSKIRLQYSIVIVIVSVHVY